MGIEDKKRLEEIRKRLYERGQPASGGEKYELKDEEIPVATDWSEPPKPKKNAEVKERVRQPEQSEQPETEDTEKTITESLGMGKKKKKYRLKLVLLGIAFFVVSLLVSSVFLLSGNNTISGENITIAINGPFTIGGGEVIPLQIGITNDNMVPINSATLIVEYPQGTRSVNDDAKDLYTERLQLDTIASGETLNIPLRATVYGEENDEKEIKASIEYRVEGSNALFFKEAEPLRFKISSSPVSLEVQNNVRVSSGQETEMVLTVTSNSPTPLREIIVKADYPSGFDFSESEPAPDYAENVWLIEELEPESSKSITVSGVMTGRESDEYIVNVSVGAAGEGSPQDLASVFVTEQVDFEIENPFVDINMTVDGQEGEEVSIEPGDNANVVIKVSNTLEETLYDTRVEVELSGNALSDVNVSSRGGFYDSTTNTITWEVGSDSTLEEILPGREKSVSFVIEPDDEVERTPQININVKVESRRVSESQVAERLEGTAKATVKVVSIPTIAADVGHNNSVFTDSGYIPPVVEEPTTYTLSYMVENGSNEITGTEVSASLPPYVTWLGETSGTGDMDFDEVNRVLTWYPGTIEDNDSAFVSFQVSFLPSRSQIGTTPTLIGEQRLKATDRFTGNVVRNVHSALTTELSSESGYNPGNGRVVSEPVEDEEDN